MNIPKRSILLLMLAVRKIIFSFCWDYLVLVPFLKGSNFPEVSSYTCSIDTCNDPLYKVHIHICINWLFTCMMLAN